VITFRNVTAAKRLTDELTHQAHHDPLTGLPNRRAFESRLRRAVISAKEQGCRHALLYFDLDHFKPVNDTAGHAAGDELLRQLAKLLRTQLREHDALARLGGDEFGILLEDATAEQASYVAEKVRRAIANYQFEWQGEIFRIGASIGQLEFADGKLSAYELLYRADEMCYLAKSRGRDRVVAFLARARSWRVVAEVGLRVAQQSPADPAAAQPCAALGSWLHIGDPIARDPNVVSWVLRYLRGTGEPPGLRVGGNSSVEGSAALIPKTIPGHGNRIAAHPWAAPALPSRSRAA
jgi:diguanylate cyclase (GGDEF)-like protein